MTRTAYRLLWVAAVLLPAILTAHAEPLAVRAAVGETDVFLGESFVFQVQVSGSERPDPPDLSGLTGFTIQERGGQKNSSQSVTLSNGRVNRVVRRGYVFSYLLTPTQAGSILIPPIAVHAEGQTARTSPITIQARKPAETDNFKLRLELSKSRCYVGEPVTLTVTWYLGREVRGFEFNIPVLGNDSLAFATPETDTSSGRQYYRIPLAGGEVIAEKGRGQLEGKPYATIRFSKIVIPRRAGTVDIEPATIACEALVGYQKSRDRFDSFFNDNFFSDFFRDDFFGRRRGRYRRVVARSNGLTLEVKDLPAEGRPPAFAGHVGEYRIDTTATPTKVNVGDPITLTVVLSGPEYMEHIDLPPLDQQAALTRDFKIPGERAEGKTAGRTKVFTQTIRALRPDVTEIPPVELPCFNTKTERYSIARSAPIPLTVRASRVVTAGDAEGRDAPVTASAVEAWTKGIAHNHEGADVLRNQWAGPESWPTSPAWIAVLVVPPLAYLFLLTGAMVTRRLNADPLGASARRAYGELSSTLKAIRSNPASNAPERVLQAIQAYLHAKLRTAASGTLTFKDVESALSGGGVREDTLRELQRIYEQCEAGRYAGRSDSLDTGDLTESALSVGREIERNLK